IQPPPTPDKLKAKTVRAVGLPSDVVIALKQSQHSACLLIITSRLSSLQKIEEVIEKKRGLRSAQNIQKVQRRDSFAGSIVRVYAIPVVLQVPAIMLVH